MAGKQSLQDVAHKLNRGLILSVGGQSPPVITGYLRWRSLLEPFFSPPQLYGSASNNAQQSTPSQLKAAHVQSACFAFICASLAYQSTQEEHTGIGGLHLTLASSCFYIRILITIDHLVDLTCIINVSSSSSMCSFDSPGDFSNEAKPLDRWSVTPWCNRSPPYLVPCCSVRSTQSSLAKTVLDKRYASRTVLPAGKHLTVQKHPYPDSHHHRLHEMGGNQGKTVLVKTKQMAKKPEKSDEDSQSHA